MMSIFPVPERDKKTSVRDRPHLREKPLRIERSHGPAIAPAKWRNGRLPEFRAFSSASRITRPLGRPVLRAASSSHLARSSGSRTVIVLLIRQKCNTSTGPSAAVRDLARLDRVVQARIDAALVRFAATGHPALYSKLEAARHGREARVHEARGSRLTRTSTRESLSTRPWLPASLAYAICDFRYRGYSVCSCP